MPRTRPLPLLILLALLPLLFALPATGAIGDCGPDCHLEIAADTAFGNPCDDTNPCAGHAAGCLASCGVALVTQSTPDNRPGATVPMVAHAPDSAPDIPPERQLRPPTVY